MKFPLSTLTLSSIDLAALSISEAIAVQSVTVNDTAFSSKSLGLPMFLFGVKGNTLNLSSGLAEATFNARMTLAFYALMRKRVGI